MQRRLQESHRQRTTEEAFIFVFRPSYASVCAEWHVWEEESTRTFNQTFFGIALLCVSTGKVVN